MLSFLQNWTLDLNNIPEYSEFRKSFVIPCDKPICELLISGLNPQITTMMANNFKNNVVPHIVDNKLTITHFQARGLGRFYCEDSVSPCAHSKHIKHTLFQYQNWLDIDMCKGHPSILAYLCAKNNMKCPEFDDIINHFDLLWPEIANYYKEKCGVLLDEDNVKYFFNLCIYGGGYSTWIKKLANVEDSEKFGYPVKIIPDDIPIHPKMRAFKNRCNIISDTVSRNNPALRQTVYEVGMTDYEIKNRVMSYFCGIIENDIVYYTYKYLVKKGAILPQQCAPEMDGLCLPRLPNVDYENIIARLNKRLAGMNIKFKIKPYKPFHIDEAGVKTGFVLGDILEMRNQPVSENIPEPVLTLEQSDSDESGYETETLAQLECKVKDKKAAEKEKKAAEKEKKAAEKAAKLEELSKQFRFVPDDNTAALLIMKDLQGLLFAYKMRLFFKKGLIWISDALEIYEKVLDFILKSNIAKTNERGSYIPYARNLKSAKNICDSVLLKVRNGSDCNLNIYNKLHSTTKGRVAFLDGVLDFKARRFYKWDEIDFEYFTTTVVRYNIGDYIKKPNMEIIQYIQSQIFQNLFEEDTQKALHFLSRGIAGHTEDKNWATYLGNRNCGKGVLYDLLKHAFEDNVKTFELDNILLTRNSNTEETSRKLYWLLDFEFARLAISQETPAPESKQKVNGKLLKKLAGGGDEQVARRNFDRIDTHFYIQSTFMFMGNNKLNVDVSDTLEHCVEFSSVGQFKTQAEIDKMKADGEPEMLWSVYKVKDPSIKDKCATLDWKMAAVYLLFSSYQDDAVVIEKEQDVEDWSLRKRILESYEITQNYERDYILVDTLVEILRTDRGKLTAELASMGTKKKKSCKGGETRNKMCFFGIKRTLTEMDDESDDGL